MVVDRGSQLLAGAQVSLGGLDRGMAQQKLDLLEGAARDAAQPGAGPPEMMGGKRGLSAFGAILAGDRPNGIFRKAFAPHLASLIDSPEETALGDPGLRGPVIHGVLDPRRHGDGPELLAFPDQVRKDPTPVAPLEIAEPQPAKLGSAQSAAK